MNIASGVEMGEHSATALWWFSWSGFVGVGLVGGTGGCTHRRNFIVVQSKETQSINVPPISIHQSIYASNNIHQ